MKRITFISDTHGKHKLIDEDLIGGDVLVHCGDMSEMGYEHEVKMFLKWFDETPYEHKIFIAGNHDFIFEQQPEKVLRMVEEYPNITYLIDTEIMIGGIKFYGTPWQPWFHDWAFNMTRNGDELKAKYDLIPTDTDILITHSPPKGKLDRVANFLGYQGVGSQLLLDKILEVNPMINCFGHIHEGYGEMRNGDTNFINCSVVNKNYVVANKPVNVEITNGKPKFNV